MKEPRSGFPTGLPQALFTGGLGCALTLLLPAIVLIILPMLRANSLLFELARARWRQARICLRCDAAYIPQEGIYVSPEHLDRLVWHSSSNS